MATYGIRGKQTPATGVIGISLLEGKAMPRVALFVDGANMFYAQKKLGWFFEYEKVYRFFVKGS